MKKAKKSRDRNNEKADVFLALLNEIGPLIVLLLWLVELLVSYYGLYRM
jgi:hypothetical protein